MALSVIRYQPQSKVDDENFRRIRNIPAVHLTCEERQFPVKLKELVVTLKKCKQQGSFHLISLNYLIHLLRFTEGDVPAVIAGDVYRLAVYSYGDRCTNFHLKWQRQEYRIELMSLWLTSQASGDHLDSFNSSEELRGTMECSMLVAAKWVMDRKWYRTLLVTVEENLATVYYIDRGNTEVQCVNTLRKLPDELQRVVPMAFRCCLADIDLKNDEDAINQGQAQLYFVSRIKMTPQFVCKIRFIENEGSMIDAKAIVVLENTRNTMQEDWERSCGSVNAAVREKLVWKNERVRYQEDVPFPEELALFQKFDLPVYQKIPCKKLLKQPSKYRLCHAVNPDILFLQEVTPNTVTEDEARDAIVQEVYRRAYLLTSRKYNIRTHRVLKNRYYVWCDSRSAQWHRVKVVRVDAPPGKCFVYRIDHGDHLLVDIKSMMEMDLSLYDLPCRVVKAHLIHLKPAQGHYWWDSCAELFQELLGKELEGVPLSYNDVKPRGCNLYDGFSYGMLLIDREFRTGYSLQAQLLLTGQILADGFTAGNPHLLYLHHSAAPTYEKSAMMRSAKEEFKSISANIFEAAEQEVDENKADLGFNCGEISLAKSWTIFHGDPNLQVRYEGQEKRKAMVCNCVRSCSSDCYGFWLNKRKRVRPERQAYRFLKCVGNTPVERDTPTGPFTQIFGRYLGAVRISHVQGCGVFYIQHVKDLPKLESMMNDLASIVVQDCLKLDDDPTGLLAAALVYNEDGERKWHRVYVSKVMQEQKIARVILYDYGSMVNVSLSNLRDLPQYFVCMPSFCRRAHLDVSQRCLRNNCWTSHCDELFSAFVKLNTKTVYLAWKPKPTPENVVQVMDYGQGVVYDAKKQHWWNGGSLSKDFPLVGLAGQDKMLLFHLLNSIGVNLCYENLPGDGEFYEFEQIEKLFL